MKQNIKKQYSIACNQYYATKSEIKQIKDTLKKETNPNELEKLKHILFEKKQILHKQIRKKENILFKTHKSYKKQQRILEFKNVMHYRLKRIFKNDDKIYSINHRHLVNKIINDMFENKNEKEIFKIHLKEKQKPVILSQIYHKINTNNLIELKK